MAPTIAQTGLGLGAVVLILGIFLGGYYLGTEYGDFTEISTGYMLRESVVKAAEKYRILKQIEEGKIKEVKGYLNLSLNGEILAIDMLRQLTKDRKAAFAADKILAMIAVYRTRNPHRDSLEEANKLVSKILTDAVDRIPTELEEGLGNPEQPNP